MRISSDDLLNLPVESQSGQHLGRISGLDVDIDAHRITRYRVKTGLIKGLWHQQLLIDPAQVISISKEKMVVEDGAVREPAAEFDPVKLATSPTK